MQWPWTVSLYGDRHRISREALATANWSITISVSVTADRSSAGTETNDGAELGDPLSRQAAGNKIRFPRRLPCSRADLGHLRSWLIGTRYRSAAWRSGVRHADQPVKRPRRSCAARGRQRISLRCRRCELFDALCGGTGTCVKLTLPSSSEPAVEFRKPGDGGDPARDGRRRGLSIVSVMLRAPEYQGN